MASTLRRLDAKNLASNNNSNHISASNDSGGDRSSGSHDSSSRQRGNRGLILVVVGAGKMSGIVSNFHAPVSLDSSERKRLAAAPKGAKGTKGCLAAFAFGGPVCFVVCLLVVVLTMTFLGVGLVFHHHVSPHIPGQRIKVCFL